MFLSRILACLLILYTCLLRGQKKSAPINDFSFTLHEETVNKVIAAIGDISGTSEYDVMLMKGQYQWTIKNPKINIRPDSSNFTCDAIVKTGFLDYKSKVIGNVKIDYDSNKNLIYVKISRAIFELYTTVFGNRVHIKDIHLEDRFKEPFAFEGPRTYTTVMEFPMPDSTKKRILIKPNDCRMELKWKEICTACEIVAEEAPLIPPVKVNVPNEFLKEELKEVPKPDK